MSSVLTPRSPSSELSEEILEQLTALSHYLGDPSRDLAILGEGNTSARLDEDSFYVKASGQHLGTITPGGFVAVQLSRILPAFEQEQMTDAEVKQALLECRMSEETAVMPSVETFFHAYLLNLPDVNYIGHTHPTVVNSILCSNRAEEAISGRLFPDEIVCCGIAPCFVEYTDPGLTLSKLIKKRVEAFYAKYDEWPKVILMQNHGLIALGKTPRDVQNITAMYVKTARILLGAYALGGPNFLTEEHVRRIHTRPDEHYRQKQIGQK